MDPHTREASAPAESLVRLLRPRSIAIVGASETPGALGELVLSNLERANYSGSLYLVNPKRATIRDHACLPSVDALPEGMDCAVLAIPGPAVIDAVAACARRRVGSLIIFSAGFAESGEDGRAAQQSLAEIARSQGFVIEGPNCLGLVNYIDGIPLTFVATRIAAHMPGRKAAILSQSGALAAVFGVNLQHHGVSLSYSISTGNEAACHIEDFLEQLLEDEHSHVFTLIVEQFRQPRKFLRLAARARSLNKFIVLLHPGSSEAARASAVTHTGALSGNHETMRTLVSATGVIVVDTMEELVDVTQSLVLCPVLPHRGAAVFAESGAFRALALDFCERIKLELPELSQATVAKLRSLLPPFILPANPLDLTAHALVDPDLYRRTLPLILDDDRFGSVLLAIILTDEATCNLKFSSILPALRSMILSKPVLFAALDEGAPMPSHYIAESRSLGVPFYPSPERALRALSILTRRAALHIVSEVPPRNQRAQLVLTHGVIPEYRCKMLLAPLGIPFPPGQLARTLDEANAIASCVGFPVVLKAQSADLSHKSDAGGVVLNIRDAGTLAVGWDRLHEDLIRSRPGLELDGVLVECMVPPGVELIVGARNDPDWGPILLVGTGGVLAEAMRDVRLVAPGLSNEMIVGELLALRCGPLLRGFGGSPKLDVDAAAQFISTLGELVMAHPAIREIDINPLVVLPEGAIALDAVMFVREDKTEPAHTSQDSIGSPT
jgi:acyl-CoA synthetase (NDP forming)